MDSNAPKIIELQFFNFNKVKCNYKKKEHRGELKIDVV